MINNYIWKGRKVYDGKELQSQSEYKMIDMTEEQLNSAYAHCKNMLYNDDKASPGRYLVLEEITQQVLYCNAELAVRWFCQLVNGENQPIYSRFNLINEIEDFLAKNNADNFKPLTDITLKDIYNGLPVDFKNITLDLFLKACKDQLGKFNKSHITYKFILNFGLWFSQDEVHNFELVEKLTTLNQRLQVVRERLNIKPDVKIPIKSTGLNYTQFRAMLNLKSNKKYTELTTVQLETLRDKVLFKLEDTIRYHIKQWETLMKQIEEVCAEKKYKLT